MVIRVGLKECLGFIDVLEKGVFMKIWVSMVKLIVKGVIIFMVFFLGFIVVVNIINMRVKVSIVFMSMVDYGVMLILMVWCVIFLLVVIIFNIYVFVY